MSSREIAVGVLLVALLATGYFLRKNWHKRAVRENTILVSGVIGIVVAFYAVVIIFGTIFIGYFPWETP